MNAKKTILENKDTLNYITSFLDDADKRSMHRTDRRSNKILDPFIPIIINRNQIQNVQYMEFLKTDLEKTDLYDKSYKKKLHIDLSGQSMYFIKKVMSIPFLILNVHTLDLAETDVCNGDVTALGNLPNLHTLDLSYTQVMDLSALDNVHTLKLPKILGDEEEIEYF